MTSLSGTTASRPERWASARSQRPIWSDGLADQRRIIESISVSARDKAVVQKMLTRMESHYYCLIRERDAQIARLIDSETAANLRLSVLERVSEAADMKHAVDLQMFEGSSMAMANELRTMRQEVTRARKLAASVEARTMAAILALGSELAAVEASEIEVRQVLGFLRQSNRAREQRCVRQRGPLVPSCAPHAPTAHSLHSRPMILFRLPPEGLNRSKRRCGSCVLSTSR